MSQQNNNDSSLAVGAAVVLAALLTIAAAIGIALSFLAFVFTILCAFVWALDQPFRCGSVEITPQGAREFILRGLAGAVLVPAFALFAVVVFGVRILPDAWLWLVMGGYVGGSIGMQLLDESTPEPPATILPPPTIEHQPRPSLPAPRPERSGPSEPAPGFRFASWDDEDELRR
jgi:hypothetical protein